MPTNRKVPAGSLVLIVASLTHARNYSLSHAHTQSLTKHSSTSCLRPG